jgi:primosomal protein N''
MKHTIRNLLGRFRRKKDPEAKTAALEAERQLADAKQDALVEAQRRDVTRG